MHRDVTAQWAIGTPHLSVNSGLAPCFSALASSADRASVATISVMGARPPSPSPFVGSAPSPRRSAAASSANESGERLSRPISFRSAPAAARRRMAARSCRSTAFPSSRAFEEPNMWAGDLR